jgi:Xaa-Pro dipeptidase
VLWYGSTPNAAKAMQLYDVDEVRYTNDLSKFFHHHLSPETTLFTLHKSQTPRYLYVDDHAGIGGSEGSFSPQSKPGVIDCVSLKPAMDRARVIKDEYEIALIRKANDISSAAHRQVARQLLRLRNEQEIEAMILASCTARGAHSQAYHIIAGAGVNASTLHYDANNQSLKGKQLVVVDAGCEYNCYASDITRTLPISGSFTPEARAIYAIVERMQEECIAAVAPGRKFVDLHLHAAKVAARGLLALGILRADSRAEVEASGIASAFFPHGLGHHVGLEVHDVSGDQRLLYAEKSTRLEGGKRETITPAELAELRREDGSDAEEGSGLVSAPVDRQILEPGMIVTVEPGM